MKTVDIQTAQKIQAKIAEYAQDHEIFEEGVAAPYTEGFLDSCVVFWEQAGYDLAEVRETVDAGVEELLHCFE